LEVLKKQGSQRFRFYGLNVENIKNQGVVYHSTGVGAAAFRSILTLEKLPVHVPEINPDIVLLDFGTNDILYHNKIDKNLVKEVEKSIKMWRELHPEVLIVLTSVQDLYYKKKYITAGIDFRNLMDSLARANDCLFWNWYDLSGGIKTIRTWYNEGYAQQDCIHLTKKGYQVKGSLLFDSFMNTLDYLSSNQSVAELTVPLKDYSVLDSTNQSLPDSVTVQPEAPIKVVKPKPQSKSYTVKSGDTLSEISRRYNVSVSKIKSANGLRSDVIRIGQRLKIPLK
jgi:LysM repeat protein